MNFVKSFWSSQPSTSNGEVYTTQESNNAFSYNSVTFTTATTNANSIIITTVPQNSQQVSYNHSTSTQVLEVPEMASPTESQKSFQSAKSTSFNQTDSNSKGKINMGYTGSRTELDNNNRQMQANQHNQVVQESYWTWQFPWANWTVREKIFLLIIVILSLCVLILTSLLSVVWNKNFYYRELIINRLGASNI